MQMQPYIFLDGRCEEAIEFYKTAIGAEVTAMMRFKDAPKEACEGLPPGSGDKVMHSALKVGDNTFMASDGRCTGNPEFKGFALSLMMTENDKAEQIFAALSAGGEVQMPMGKTFFAERFGMVADKFGVSWMVLAGPG